VKYLKKEKIWTPLVLFGMDDQVRHDLKRLCKFGKFHIYQLKVLQQIAGSSFGTVPVIDP